MNKNEKIIWEIFMNVPGAEALELLAMTQKILVARCILKLPRTRKKKEESK